MIPKLLLVTFASLVVNAQQCFEANRPKPGNPTVDNSPPSDGGSDGGDCLNMHNKYRRDWRVGTMLKWNSNLAAQAQNWANYLNSRRTLQHSQNTNQGENLYMGDGSCSSALESWMSENYRGGPVTSSNFQSVGHLTQIIWKDTQQVGCASAGRTVVCRYYPAGNYLGQSPV